MKSALLLLGIVFIVGCISLAPLEACIGSDECELSLCDCKCHVKGQTPEAKDGRMCGINCLAEYNVSGCSCSNNVCTEVKTQATTQPVIGRPPTKPKLEYMESGCSRNQKVREGITISPSRSSVSIKHNVMYTCCANITLSLEQEDSTLKVIETNTGDVCRCLCTYEINAKIINLLPGEYNVEVYGIKYRDVHPLELKGSRRVSVSSGLTVECSEDSDCVPAQCCHPTSCTTKANAPNCAKTVCSMVCQGPLDCGAGRCACVNNQCSVVSGE